MVAHFRLFGNVGKRHVEGARDMSRDKLVGATNVNDDGFRVGIHAGLGFGRRNVFVGHGKRLFTVNDAL